MNPHIRTALIGLVMGAAEIVPGVSGGTIAFISGITVRLVNSLKRFTPALLLELKDNGLRSVWQSTDATFLTVLFAAMGLSIIVFANAISYLLHNEPIGLWSFFFGLVLASCWIIGRDIAWRDLDSFLAVGTGVVIGFFVTHLAPVEIQPSPVALFLAGMVAVCAWILPGISGSFILLILGLHAFVVEVIRSVDVISLLALAAGCVIGLVGFAQVLSILFARFRNLTLSILTGFMMGSLAKLWPWKNTISYHLKSDGTQIPLVQESILPQTYESLMQQDADIMIAIIAAASGCVFVLMLDRLAGRSDTPA